MNKNARINTMGNLKIKIMTVDLDNLKENVEVHRIYEVFSDALLVEMQKYSCPIRLIHFFETQEMKEHCQELFRHDGACDYEFNFIEETKKILDNSKIKDYFSFGNLRDPFISYITYTNLYGY
jgi:hypothetical protein